MANSYAPTTLLSAVVEQELADSRLTETTLLGLLAPNMKLQTQRNIEWAARLTDAAVSSRAVGDATTEDTKGSLGKAVLTIPDYYVKYQFKVLRRDLIEAASTGQVEAVRDAVGTEVADAVRGITRKINQVLYTATGTANATHFGIIGLNSIAAQTGSYAGLSRTTYPRWKCIVQQGTTPGTPETLSVDRLNALLRARRNAGATYSRNDGSNLIILTTDEIENDVMRKIFNADTQVQTPNAAVNANVAPFTSYSFKGIPVVSDVDSPANLIQMIDLSKLRLYSFDESAAGAMNNSKISFPRYQNLQFRMATVNDQHPDFLEMELAISLQLKAHDPIQTISRLEDVHHANVV